MMYEKCEELIEKVNQIEDCFGTMFSKDFINMTSEEFVMVKAFLGAFDLVKEVTLTQAKIMDEQSEKLDKILLAIDKKGGL